MSDDPFPRTPPDQGGEPTAGAPVAPDAPQPDTATPAGVAPPADRGVRLLLDRTAVLVAGLVAGFVVGQSFSSGPPAVPSPSVPLPAAAAGDPPRAGPAGASPTTTPVAVPAVPPVADAAGAIDPRVVRRVRADGRIRVGVFGDSFGNGVWDALYRQLPQGDGFEVLRFSKEATGFTRYRTLDLEARARTQLARDPVDVAVISFGANDAQPLYDDGHLYPFMGDGWQRVVGARVERFVATARSTGAIVYWVGLPAMRDPVLDGQMQDMDRFYAQHMRRLGVRFLDSRPLSLDAQGHYNAYLPDKAGVPRLMRTGDGMHMIGIGYQRLTERVAADVRVFADRARRAAGRRG